MSGGFGVKNNAKTRKFLNMWANLEMSQPTGFSSSDNGAIHLALMNWFKGINHTKVQECTAVYRALIDDVTNLDPYWNFVYCARRALGMGEWEGQFFYREKDKILKEVRTKALQLKNNGISVKIFPRFKGFMVDWVASDQSKSAVFWHGVKDTQVLHKHWKLQDNNTIFPKCDLYGDEHTYPRHVRPRFILI